MAEYIDREAVRNELYDADAITMKGVAILNKFPAADVAPVVHGRWVEVPWVYFGVKRYMCDQCFDDEYWKKRIVTVKEKFCPNCGATMDGKD